MLQCVSVFIVEVVLKWQNEGYLISKAEFIVQSGAQCGKLLCQIVGFMIRMMAHMEPCLQKTAQMKAQ